MRVAVQRLEGVESVRVSLNDGVAEIRLAPENSVTLARVREIIRSNGFSPKAAEVVVAGIVIEHEGAPALATDGATPAYALVDHAAAPGTVARLPTGRRVEIRGRVPESQPNPAGELPRLEVRSHSPARSLPDGLLNGGDPPRTSLDQDISTTVDMFENGRPEALSTSRFAPSPGEDRW